MQEQNLNSTSFDVAVIEEELGEEMMETNGEREIWELGIRDEKENLLNANVVNTNSADHTNSTLYADHFSPCISSSSSSTPALTKPPIASSSSASSSAIYFDTQQQLDFHTTKTTHHHAPQEALSSIADGSIVDIGDVDCMHLINGEDLWDPSSILHTDDDQNTQDNDQYYQRDEECGYMFQENSEVVQENHHEKQRVGGLDELGAMFFEWLKTNKHHISAHDLRNIKLKRSTIESASKRLGNTKEGRKQLLKLILQWVEQCQLHKKLSPQQTPAAMLQIPCQYEEPFPNPNPNHLNSIPNDHPNYTCLTPLPPPSNSIPHPATMMAAPPLLFAGCMGGDPRYNSSGVSVPPTEFEMLDSVRSWPPSQFSLASHYNPLPENGNFAPITPQPMPQSTAVYSDQQYPYPVFNNGNGILLLRQDSAASKEARKKRMMAQQRRCLVHHYRHHPPNQNKHHHNDTSEQQNAANNIGGENCTNNIAQASPTGNWVFWPPAATVPAVVMLAQPPTLRQLPEPIDQSSMQPQSYQWQAHSEHRQVYI